MIRRLSEMQRCLIVLILAFAIVPFSAGAQGNSGAAHACQGEGYAWLAGTGGETFQNVGQCVRYAAQGGAFAEDAIVVPAGYFATFSDQVLAACSELSYGYLLSDGVSGGSNGKSATACSGNDTFSFEDVTIGPFSKSRVLVIYLTDASCGATYVSNGSHGRVTGSWPQFSIDIADAGPGCSIIDDDWTGGGRGNLSLTVTVHQ